MAQYQTKSQFHFVSLINIVDFICNLLLYKIRFLAWLSLGDGKASKRLDLRTC